MPAHKIVILPTFQLLIFWDSIRKPYTVSLRPYAVYGLLNHTTSNPRSKSSISHSASSSPM